MKRIKQRKKSHFFYFDMRYAAAAAVVVAIGGAAMFSNGTFTKPHTVGEIAVNPTEYSVKQKSLNDDKQSSDSASIDEKVQTETEADTSVTKVDVAEKQTATDNNKESIKTSGSANNNTPKPVMSDRDSAVNTNEKSRAESIIISRPKNDAVSDKEITQTQQAQAEKAEISEDRDVGANTLNRYIEIAAVGIGKALDSLNISANRYIGELYAAHSEQPAAVSVARSMEATPMMADYGAELENDREAVIDGGADCEQQEATADSDMTMEKAKETEPKANNSYDVLCDSEKYYSVKINTVFEDEPERVYSKAYTVDKEKEALVTLDDVYSDEDNYKARLYDNICTQMEEQMQESENVEYYIGYGFSEITGNEDFYINNTEEVVITFDAGIVAPYKQGESSFNVGTLK